MKAADLEIYFQQVINNVGMEEQEEVGLGFETMLSHEVVRFLMTDHSITKPFRQHVLFKLENECGLDEYELAMV